jgi:hypothetical protein
MMKNMENPELQTAETNLINKEKLALTNKVLAKLFLWGLVTFSSFVVPEKSLAVDLDNTSSEVVSFENRFKNDGLLAVEREGGKPVVVITSKNNIDSNFSTNNSLERTENNLYINQMTVDLLAGGKIRITERDSNILNEIVEEVEFGDTGLVKEGEEAKLGNWLPADYYVVSSVTNSGVLVVIENQIINMKDGSSITVQVESVDKQPSDQVIHELTQKTEKAIEEIQLNK